MNTVDFDYPLPPELIAQQPAARRDASRMLVVHRGTGHLEHRTFEDLPTYLRRGDLLVVNNTRVIAARLFARKPGTGGRVELFLLEEAAPGEWEILLRARRRPAVGQSLDLEGGSGTATILGHGDEGRARVRFDAAIPFLDYVERHGHVPLPPYIKRVTSDQCPVTSADGTPVTGHRLPVADRERYQTVYAREPGAVAAPTAGLHFTPEVLRRLAENGVDRADITLHVGIGTFRPVKAERVEEHRMEAERYEVPAATAAAIRRAKNAGGRVIAVGSTSVRTLEAVAKERGQVVAAAGRTDLFIHEPFAFQVVDAMLTNFHLPKSTLLMMVCAFAARPGSPQAGRDLVLGAYEAAVKERYRFFSYGDCMLIV